MPSETKTKKQCGCLTSITKKQVMAITGLLLCGFLLTHMLGNFLIFVGPKAFNIYAHTLTSNKLIYVAEVILLGIFGSHIFMAIRLIIENKNARPDPYFMRKHSGRGSTLASSTMPITGMIALVFLVLHILGIKFGAEYLTTYDGMEIRDIYKTTVLLFKNPMNVAFYIIAVSSLGLHVSHGFWSAFQSLGFNHPKYFSKIQCLSKLYGVFIAVGYSSFPLYCHFCAQV